jgi:hypothetical protein
MIDLPSFAKIEPKPEEEDQLKLSSDATPLDGLRAIYTNGKIPLSTRLRAMTEAAPYVHPKLAVTASIEGKDFAALLGARLKKINGGHAKVIEGPKTADLDL